MTEFNVSDPEWKYDKEADAGYLKFADAEVYATQTHDYVNVDIDEDGNVIGIEVLL